MDYGLKGEEIPCSPLYYLVWFPDTSRVLRCKCVYAGARVAAEWSKDRVTLLPRLVHFCEQYIHSTSCRGQKYSSTTQLQTPTVFLKIFRLGIHGNHSSWKSVIGHYHGFYNTVTQLQSLAFWVFHNKYNSCDSFSWESLQAWLAGPSYNIHCNKTRM